MSSPIICPNPDCQAVLTTLRRIETRAYLKTRMDTMTLGTRVTDKLRRGPTRWRDFRYWLTTLAGTRVVRPHGHDDEIIEEMSVEETAFYDGQAYLRDRNTTEEETSQELLRHRKVFYECPFCRTWIAPQTQGWVDPLDVLPRPTEQDVVTCLEGMMLPYYQFGGEPSLMIESEMVLNELEGLTS